MTIPASFLDELRARITLSTLIGRTVPLKRAGREWKACCPFHQEKTPSFWVNDEKGFYHCFGCGAHGDAIRWMTDQRGATFPDAVRELADEAGLTVPAGPPRDAAQDERVNRGKTVMVRAAAWFAKMLSSDGGSQARLYLAQRGVDDGMLHTFGLGYAPRSARDQASPISRAMVGVLPETLVALGLMKKPDDGRAPYDFFRDRIIFPIHDQRGQVIAFGGRLLGPGEPKYLNSPDTLLFDKGRTLFNLHRASPAAAKAKRLVIVEGYMDVIGLAGVGVAEAVAPNGTALTEAQIVRAWRLADVPICCFDGDRAGRAAAARAAIRALKELSPGKSLAFAFPPAGQDPDDVARAGGREAVEAMLTAAVPLHDLLFRHEREAMTSQSPEQIVGLKQRLRVHLDAIGHVDVRREYERAWTERFVEMAQPRRNPQITPSSAAEKWRKSAPRSNDSRRVAAAGIADGVELAILQGLLSFPDLALSHAEPLVMFNYRHRDVANAIARIVEVGYRQGSAIHQVDLPSDLRECGLTETVDAAIACALPLPFTVAGQRRAGREAARAALIDTIEGIQR